MAQGGISGIVAEGVVDALEIVDIDHGNGQRDLGSNGAPEDLGTRFKEIPSVVEVCQVVTVAELLDRPDTLDHLDVLGHPAVELFHRWHRS